jgi:hypothetical protein
MFAEAMQLGRTEAGNIAQAVRVRRDFPDELVQRGVTENAERRLRQGLGL